MIDLHVHTNHSHDSKATIREQCEKAVRIGLQYLCFTDHINMNKADPGYGLYDAEKFFGEFNEAKEKYSGRLKLLCGIEFSEPHIYTEEFEKYRKLPYDFILGSVHYWINDMRTGELVSIGYPAEDAYEKYWEEIYKAVAHGGFDSLAHIDFPKRFYKECVWQRERIYSIFEEMAKNDIALEINTSSLRRGLTEAMPDREFLKMYEQAGGTRVTIGSDAHSPDDLAAGYDYACSLITGRLTSVVYINREPVPER